MMSWPRVEQSMSRRSVVLVGTFNPWTSFEQRTRRVVTIRLTDVFILVRDGQ